MTTLRGSQRGERVKSYNFRQDNLDKRLSDIREQIDHSKEKIDNYLSKVGGQIGVTINKKINQFVAFHDQIVEAKQKQIELQKQLNEHYRETELFKKYTKFEEIVKENQENMKRYNDILLMYKKQAEKYKIELDIKQKQLDSCKKRQKELMKKVWCLEEDIRDIYSYQKNGLPSPNQLSSAKHRKMKSQRNKTNTSELAYSKQNISKTIKARDVHNRNSSNLLVKDSKSLPKPSIYDLTTLSQHLNTEVKERYKTNQTQIATSSARPSFQQNRPVSGVPSSSYFLNQKKKVSIYDDLRHGLRNFNEVNLKIPTYLEKDRRIGLDQFRLITLKLPQILKQIENIPIEEQSFLKQVDSHSIWLLNDLISHPNAVKILEIILFNYSLEAINEIKDKKQALTIQQNYNQPIFDEQLEQIPSSRIPKKNKHKIDLSIHKTFKSKMVNQKVQLHSFRNNLLQ